MKKYNEILDQLKKLAPGNSIKIKYSDTDSDYENYDLALSFVRKDIK